MLILFNKPFNVLSQFTGDAHARTLAEFIDIPHVYAAERCLRRLELLRFRLVPAPKAFQTASAGRNCVRRNRKRSALPLLKGEACVGWNACGSDWCLRRRLFKQPTRGATAFGGTASVPSYPCFILLTLRKARHARPVQ